MDDGVEAERHGDVFADELLGYGTAESAVPAGSVETQQVCTIKVGFADPQFADRAVGKRFVHRGSLLTLERRKTPLGFTPRRGRATNRESSLILQCSKNRASNAGLIAPSFNLM